MSSQLAFVVLILLALILVTAFLTVNGLPIVS